MSELPLILVSYDNSDNDLPAVICSKYRHDGKLKIRAGYVGDNAQELYKIVSEQGYLAEHDKEVRNKTIDEVIDYINTHRFGWQDLSDFLEQLKGEEHGNN